MRKVTKVEKGVKNAVAIEADKILFLESLTDRIPQAFLYILDQLWHVAYKENEKNNERFESFNIYTKDSKHEDKILIVMEWESSN